MANAKQPTDSLTYKVRDLATVKAACERFIPSGMSPRGIFQNSGKVKISQVTDSDDKLDFLYELTVTGKPKEGEEGSTAFSATCEVGCLIEFSRPQGEDLPAILLRQLTEPLYYLAFERCRTLVSSMGYPSPAIRPMPYMETTKKTGESKTPKKAAAKARRVRSKVGAGNNS